MHQQEACDLKTNWGYGEKNGPWHWREAFEVADGCRQSPINIETGDAVFDKALLENPLKMAYQAEAGLKICNTGHSIQAKINQVSELQGGPLEGTYRLEQFHMHWGSIGVHGSEHTIDSRTFAGELHLVHYNTKYGEFSKAVTPSDGLAVVGIMIKEGNAHPGLAALTDNAGSVGKDKADFTVPGSYSPECLLPENRTDYWTYLGSLTTPPLLESVTWVVMKEPIEMSKEQLGALRNMTDSHGLAMQDNFRPPCPLKGRLVRKSFQ